ncbi:hypothetical protein F0562_033797 [Nyssa sinensis]|uniref:Methyltransferase type 11 domain-containing protein n=1 Tax=Nyssa sinensis TaxID=561372 RepID=A0A5J5AGP6_9ASTE|nr:hypothetical protein F0562_033797 [Nyssa sinensis]
MIAIRNDLFDVQDMLNRVRSPRADWYEEFYASALDKGTKSYEAEIAGRDNGVRVFGTDPNRKMEKYARAAAVAAGLPPTNFKFIQAVAEALPLSDASVDAVVGTIVLCSVTDVDMTLKEVMRVLKPGGLYLFVEHVAAKDGTILRFLQGVLDPLQQKVADGCHLTRNTGKYISEAGFSSVNINMAFLSNALFANPHAYGIARK